MKTILRTLILAGMLTLVACGGREIKSEEDFKGEKPLDQVVTQDEMTLEDVVANMSTEEKLGQLLMVGFEGEDLNDQLKAYMDDLHIGGVIFFKRNLNSYKQVVDMTNNIKDYNGEKPGIFLSIDEEGGLVSRLPSEFEKLPNSILLENRRDLSYELGQILGERLNKLGLNLNYAPVMDIHSNKSNPVINERAFGTDVDSVSENSNQVVKGMKDRNILAVGKHFPGHGDTSVDSHLALPTIDKTREEIETFEMAPFKHNMDNGLDGLMVGHLLVPNVDGDFATVSKKWIGEIIREDLNFQGLVFSDDMTMKAIENSMTIEEASNKFIVSGGDILLICHGYDNPYKVYERLLKSVETGEFTEESLNEKVIRILKLKEKYEINNEKVEETSLDEINTSVRNYRRELGLK